jgi:hypothetical protein
MWDLGNCVLDIGIEERDLGFLMFEYVEVIGFYTRCDVIVYESRTYSSWFSLIVCY